MQRPACRPLEVRIDNVVAAQAAELLSENGRKAEAEGIKPTFEQ